MTKAALLRILSILLLCLFGVGVIAMQQPQCWILWGAGVAVLCCCQADFRNHIGLLYFSMAVLGLTPVGTDIEWSAIGKFSVMLMVVLLTPWAISKFLLKTNVVEFRFAWRQPWNLRRVGYVLFALTLSYFLFPWYLKDASAPAAFAPVPAYENWTVGLEFSPLFRLFLGTNGLGIWDELFFVNVVYATFRRYYSVWTANALQAVFFTAFLFDLGFTGWGPFLIYPFALLKASFTKRPGVCFTSSSSTSPSISSSTSS